MRPPGFQLFYDRLTSFMLCCLFSVQSFVKIKGDYTCHNGNRPVYCLVVPLALSFKTVEGALFCIEKTIEEGMASC